MSSLLYDIWSYIMNVDESKYYLILNLILSQRGDTPLHVAAFHGKIEVAELLISKGATVNLKNNVISLRYRS